MDGIIEHHFRVDIAEKVGVNAAVIYNSIVWWCSKNKDNNESYHDGYWWMFHSRSAWVKSFPYLTEQNIKTALAKLCDAGLIVKGCFNEDKFDRTNWYAVTDKGSLVTNNHSLVNSNQSTGCYQPINIVNDNIVNSNLVKERENNNNARTREDLIAEITENTQWVENQMKAGLTKEDVTELVNYAYDYLFNTTANEPSKGDVVRCAHYKIQEFKEYKRRAAVKAAPKEERRMAFWKESQRYYAQYSKQMRNDFVAYYIKDLKEDPDLMVFEQWPNFDMPAQLKQWKLKNEQRQSSTI